MEEKRGFFQNKKYILIGLLIVIALITIFVVSGKDNKYKSLEESMLATTKNYVKMGRISTKEDYYFTLKEMGMKETYNCNKDSGVLVTTKTGRLEYEVYLICGSYKSPKMKLTESKYITILGANPLIVDSDSSFVDPGYNANGYEVQSSTNYKNSPGLYTVTYLVSKNGVLKEKVVRYIAVGNFSSIDAPVITLNGDSNVVLKVGSTYVESGYLAIDPNDGSITSRVKIKSNVNTREIGEYEIIYQVTNSRGISATKKRLVSIIDADLNMYAQATIDPDSVTKNKVTINLKVVGNNYSYMVLPNKTRSNDTLISYEVTENNLYVFKIYDIYDNYTEKKVLIDNIDKIPPTGTCEAISQGGVVTYTVNAEDDSGIKGYSYYTGSEYTEFRSSNTFKYIMDYNVASAIIQDVAGNTTKVSCTKKKISTIVSATIPESKTVYIGDSYIVPVTISPSTGDKKEIYFDILSGGSYITLTKDGTVKGVSAGTAVIRMRVTDSDIEKQMIITVKKKEANYNWSPDYSDTSTPASWCTKSAAVLKAYMNGREVADRSKISMNVGETIRITLYLTKECGNVKHLTRTSADGQSNWQQFFSAESVPYVDRYDASTFVSTDHFDWVITANKKANEVILTQTTFQSTSKYREIKSFFHITVTAK